MEQQVTDELDPELRAYLATRPSSHALSDDLTTLRETSLTIENAEVERWGPLDTEIKESWSTIPMYDGFVNDCKIFQPKIPEVGGNPLVVLFHGGGFAVGSPSQCTSLGRALVKLCGAICVAPAYRLVPEHPFPTSATDAWDTIEFIAANATTMLGANLAKGFVVGGASSGGNLAAVVTQLAKDRGLYPPLTGQYLSVPLIVWEGMIPSRFQSIYGSMEKNSRDPIHPPSSLKAMLARYNPDIHSVYFSPINSNTTQHSLPPAYIQACGLDCIRDDAIIYHQILREQGVKSTLDLYKGMPHGWWLFMPQLKSSLHAMADSIKGIGHLLGRDVAHNAALIYFRRCFGPGAAVRQR